MVWSHIFGLLHYNFLHNCFTILNLINLLIILSSYLSNKSSMSLYLLLILINHYKLTKYLCWTNNLSIVIIWVWFYFLLSFFEGTFLYFLMHYLVISNNLFLIFLNISVLLDAFFSLFFLFFYLMRNTDACVCIFTSKISIVYYWQFLSV